MLSTTKRHRTYVWQQVSTYRYLHRRERLGKEFCNQSGRRSGLMTVGDSRAPGYSVTSPPWRSRSLEVDLELDTAQMNKRALLYARR